MKFVEIEPKDIKENSFVVVVWEDIKQPWVDYVKEKDGDLYEYSPRTDSFDKFYATLEDEMPYCKFFIIKF